MFTMFAMQYGQALERHIRKVVKSIPVLGPMHVLKADVSGDVYLIGLRLTYAPNWGIFFHQK